MNWVVIAAFAIFLGSIWLGWHRGFLKTVLAMIQLVMTILLVLILSPILKNILIENTGLYNQTKSSIVSSIEDRLPELPEGIEIPEEVQNEIIENSTLPSLLRDLLKENNTPEMYAALGVSTFLDYIGSYMAEFVLSLVSFLIAFIVVRIVFQILVLAFDLIGKLPVLGGLNQMAGAVLGGVRGLIFLWLLCLLATAFPETKIGGEVLSAIGNSTILSLVYNNNLLLKLLFLLGMKI
jgi:hypothetical protein